MSKPARRILVTGFEPFGRETMNPSAAIASALHGRSVGGHEIVGVELPCCFGLATKRLVRHMELTKPKLVICLGQAGGRAEITPERIAINIDDANIPDNAGRQPVDRPVVRNGPPAYWSTLPVKAIITALKSRGIPAAVSQTAGTFVCNHVFYGLMHALRETTGVRGGFIHVPWLPEQAAENQPSLPLTVMVEAIGETIAVSLRARRPPQVSR
jgi:pyroglutamyl-peptidase